jgi:hypothetical protein
MEAMRLFEQYEAAGKVRRLASRTIPTSRRWVAEFLRFHQDRTDRWIHPQEMGEREVEALNCAKPFPEAEVIPPDRLSPFTPATPFRQTVPVITSASARIFRASGTWYPLLTGMRAFGTSPPEETSIRSMPKSFSRPASTTDCSTSHPPSAQSAAAGETGGC